MTDERQEQIERERITKLERKVVTSLLIDSERKDAFREIAEAYESLAREGGSKHVQDLISATRWYEAAGVREKAIAGYKQVADIYMGVSVPNSFVMGNVIHALIRLGFTEEAGNLEDEMTEICGHDWNDEYQRETKRDAPLVESYLRRILR